MRSRMNTARLVSVAMMFVGAAAIVSATVVGWTGFPTTIASAALIESVVPVEALGVESDSAMLLGEEVPADTRLDEAVEDADTVAAAGLLAHAKKRITVQKVAKKVAAKRIAAKPGRVSASGWRSARVSWYGPGFYGNTMAGGGKLRRDSMVVAHRSMPFGTRIEFSYRGQSVIAVVRDRGPFIHGRVFDLGPGTAKALGFGGVGTVKYRIL